MTLITRTLFICFASIALVVTAGCSSSKSRVGGALNLDTDLKLTFILDADINPDDNKSPSPVFVRMYELKSPTLFDKADFIDIYERDKEVLGGEMITKQSLKPLKPGETRTERFVLQGGTHYVALYAEFSQYPGSVYKVSFPVTENNIIRNKATIKISGTRMTLVKE